jgi:GNAT superfamily N-acetyltransferase
MMSGKETRMPTLTIYEQENFPSVYNWQAIAFMRGEWPSIFQGDILYLSEPYPPELEPIHFVIAEGESLLSYATLMKRDISHAGQDYTIYGFGNMFTFAPYRKHGYGRKILHTATEYIQHRVIDVAISFCDKTLEKYYAAEGWLTTHSPTYLGYPKEALPYEPLRMMLFISEKGKAAHPDFENSPLRIDYPW